MIIIIMIHHNNKCLYDNNKKIGTPMDPGIMVLTLQDLFLQATKREKEERFKITLSYLEVYNESIKDLMNPDNEECVIQEDPIRGVIASGITELVATSSKEVFFFAFFFEIF